MTCPPRYYTHASCAAEAVAVRVSEQPVCAHIAGIVAAVDVVTVQHIVGGTQQQQAAVVLVHDPDAATLVENSPEAG